MYIELDKVVQLMSKDISLKTRSRSRLINCERVDRQETDEIEDVINNARRKHDIAGGGIDGGFSQEFSHSREEPGVT